MTTTALGQWHLTVWGKPRTKKTHNQLVRAGKRTVMVPSKAWRRWAKDAPVQCSQGTGWPLLGPDLRLNCRAHFYRDARRGDAVGFYQGLADLLEKRGVIQNDSQIVSWDGSRLFVCRESPRVELTLEEVVA